MPQQRRCSRFILGVLFLGLLTEGALTGSPAQAVDAVGPYYAVPSWDQKKAAANRFVVLTNWASEAVLDKETGLVWEKATASDQRTWGTGSDNARLACASRTVGGRKGWRLPSIAELASLIDPTQTNPPLPQGHPFTIYDTLSTFFWSATTDAVDSNKAWVVHFIGDGYVFSLNKPSTGGTRVWCVRGGMNADAY